MKTNRVKRFSIITFILTLILTGGIFAYWADSILGSEKDSTVAITIGEGQALTTTLNLEEIFKTQGKLVPNGLKVNTDETEEIIVRFEVRLQANETGGNGAEATLIVTVLDTGHHLIVVEVLEHEDKIVAGGTAVEVSLKITLTEPENKQQYDEVANKNFAIEIQFDALI